MTKKIKIPVTFLAKGWAKNVADELGYSESMVRKVAYAHENNPVIFSRLLELAEEGKKAASEIVNRVTALEKQL